MGETVLSCTLTSVAFGLVCGHVGSALAMESVGPVVPYLVGSWVGYTFGLVGQWTMSKRLALSYANKYPSLLAYCLHQEWDLVVPAKSEPHMAEWIQQGGMGRMTMSILAAQSCRNDVEEIKQRNRQRVVNKYGGNGEDDSNDDDDTE